VAKFWDAVNDPLFGWLSDRTTSRFGKRRVYMIFGALPLAVSIALLWSVPHGLPNVGGLPLDCLHLHALTPSGP
jgi:GPH family glycoside/pentoside/hexuronide:cation symporter